MAIIRNYCQDKAETVAWYSQFQAHVARVKGYGDYSILLKKIINILVHETTCARIENPIRHFWRAVRFNLVFFY